MSSHEDKKVNDEFLRWLNKMCGARGLVKAARGPEHDCPGMTFEFGDGKAKTGVVDCVKNVPEDFPMKFLEKDTHGTPAAAEMFSEDLSEKLCEEKREIFHRTTAKGLFS